jgi:hypothetical protein
MLTTGGTRVIIVDVVMSGLERSVAVMTTVCADGIAAGAVYTPEEEMAPAPAGLMVQFATVCP